MALNWKRILLLIGFIAGVILIGYLLYFFFLRPAIPTTPTGVNGNVSTGALPGAGTNVNIQTATNVNGALPGAGGKTVAGPPAEIPPQTIISSIASGGVTKITALTQTTAYDATLAANGFDAAYYDKTTGLFYRITPDGRSVPLSDQVFYQVDNVTWAPNKQKAVLQYPDGSNIVYDFANQKQVTLPQHWKDFSFSPDSNQIAFKSIGTDADSSWLAIANADGSAATKIIDIGNEDANIYPAWSPTGQIVASYTEDKNFDQQNLYFIGQNGENFKSTVIDGHNFQGQWSTRGDRLLYSVYSSASDFKPTLWIVQASGDNIGQNRKALNLETWADKCTFANNDMVYCAVPTSLQQTAGIFASELDNSPCDIYKIDLSSGIKTKIATPQGSPNIGNVMVTSDSHYLYYTSKTDGKLYKINLK